MITKEKILCVADVEDITIRDKVTGERIPKVKYTFLDELGEFTQGYKDFHDDTLDAAKLAVAMWDRKLAVVTKWGGREWQGQWSWKLL